MAGALSKSNGCADGLIGAQLLRGRGTLESLVINDSWQTHSSATLFLRHPRSISRLPQTTRQRADNLDSGLTALELRLAEEYVA